MHIEIDNNRHGTRRACTAGGEMTPSRRWHAVAAVFLALASLGVARAADWPEKPVRLVVPYAPGGNLDVSARLLATRFQALLGQPFVVENRPGAAGLIAGEFVARAPADGYTYFVGANGPLLYSPLILRRPVYRWDKDFMPVGSIAFTPMVILVSPKVAANNLKELLDLARKQDLSMASQGSGSAPHLLSELLQATAGVRWTTVHYKGSAPALTALIAGDVAFSVELVSTALPQIQAGSLHAIAVTSPRRTASLPNVATVGEQGFPTLESEAFSGLFAPANTPPAVLARFAATIEQVVAEPEIAARFTAMMNAEARALKPDAFTRYLKGEYDKWSEIIERAKIQAE